LAAEECVNARDSTATINVSRFGGFRSSADDPSKPWRRWVLFWGTTPACRNTGTKRFGKAMHFGVQVRACPWGSIHSAAQSPVFEEEMINAAQDEPWAPRLYSGPWACRKVKPQHLWWGVEGFTLMI